MGSGLILVPMLSSTPDGTINAGLGVRALLGLNRESQDRAKENRWDKAFLLVNDKIGNRWVRWAIRWVTLHLAAMIEAKKVKVFTSHHAPFFSSGHLVIIHDVIPFRMPSRYPAQTFYTRHFLSTVMLSAESVVTISEAVKNALVELFPEIRLKLCVIPSYSTKLENAAVADAVQVGGRRPKNFLMVGMTRRHKNLDWGAKALEVAAARMSGLRLDAVGVWRDFWPDVIAASSRPNRRSELVLHDYVSEDVLNEYYAKARALLYLSTDEGMGLPPLEALARGCPVVCSDIPIFREVCGEAAFFVPLHDIDALASLIVKLASGELDGEIQRRVELSKERIAAYGFGPLSHRWRALLGDYIRTMTPVVI